MKENIVLISTTCIKIDSKNAAYKKTTKKT